MTVRPFFIVNPFIYLGGNIGVGIRSLYLFHEDGRKAIEQLGGIFGSLVFH